MNASIQKSVLFVTIVLLMMSLSVSAEETVTQPHYFAGNATPVTSVRKSTFNSSRNPMNALLVRHAMPLAREDVDPIKTAIVPGKVNVPATAPTREEIREIFPALMQPEQPQDRLQNPYAPVAPTYPSQQDLGRPVDPDRSQLKISARATDPKMQGFLRSTSMQQLTTLFQEASRMIDSRHVNPPAYEVRTQAALRNLVNVLENEDFWRVHRGTPNANAIRTMQQKLSQSMTAQPARTATEAVGLMQWSAELVSRQTGIRREAIALEFINGTIDSLDKYSSFMPEASAYAPGAELEGRKTASLEENIVGIGVELETHPLGAVIVGIVDNSPATSLGLQEGDIIVAVNRQTTEGLSLNEVAGKMGGPAGTTIQVDIERDGQRYRGSLTRRRIYVSSVTGTKMVDESRKVGYVRLKQFSESTRKDLEQSLWKLHNAGMQSLVLDLRGNPGGLLDQAIEVSNLFLPCGTIVSTKGRNLSDNSEESATHQRTWSVPLVVLIDKNSASASEIFAAAIQENERGVIVGQQSYGKGTVQTHFPLQTVSGLLKLTTAKFYSPSGREMAGVGVRPDVFINETSTGYRGTQDDPVLDGALATIQQGAPDRLAQQAATCKRTKYQSPNLTNNLNSNNWGQELQQNIFGR